MRTTLRPDPSARPSTLFRWVACSSLLFALAACGGGEADSSASADTASKASVGASDDDGAAQSTASDGPSSAASWTGVMGSIDDALLNIETLGGSKAQTTQVDAVRLANQATFGPTEALVSRISEVGATHWIADQMSLRQSFKRSLTGTQGVKMPLSRYTSGGTNAVHKHTSRTVDFCQGREPNCWRDWSSSTPLVWDFYRNAVNGPDQLRQRVGLALQQLVVVSNFEVSGTYGLRNYNNMLLDHAFGNYRDLLRKVILSPVMGDYLDHVNNDKLAPNENFARELLQLFSLGTCELNSNGTLKSGACIPTYNNEQVRAYAFALTGWTYPAGGATPWGCWPQGSNCQFYDGDMVTVAAFHDTQARALLSGVSLASGHNAATALDAVLNSLMNHPNIGPFVSRHLIQQLVTSNPSSAYVQRVVNAFNTGRFERFGRGIKGDLAATVAAILLDSEARSATPGTSAGRLREPIQLFTGTVRALNGRTDGDALGWSWGEELRQHAFRSPSVFNYYPPDYPVAGTVPALVGPAFGIHNANTALNRLNFLNSLIMWDGPNPSTNVPNAVGTKVNLSAFTADATNPERLVERLSLLALGERLPAASHTAVVNAVSAFSSTTATDKTNRVKQAAFLVFASPQYQLTR
ncbi:DUF1800 domain-containing protein [Hydrogenophaga sp. A37]|uniref:DUF1800 domain-containing protein n=1 Tax=Hydrogenophaga sp. A37 TaxID=1945864 RepID=UPI00209A734F|nr:DUF1800 family protein [Hydrogenophaga sp. A37]